MKFFLQNLNKTKIGILGGGQLGWMMILEGRKYPVKFYVLDVEDSPACRIADRCYHPSRYKEMIDEVDVVTYEFEHVYEEALNYSDEKNKLVPGINSVKLKRERWREKVFYKNNGIPTPTFFITNDAEEALKIARNEFNYYCVIKQSKGGYDGKGQYFIKNEKDFEKYSEEIKKINDVFIVEKYVDFDYEASIIVVRSRNGVFKTYPPTYNYNEKGILVYNYGPLPNKDISMEIINIAKKLVESLNYVGVMGIEFFVKNNNVMVNEFAPRVHNTGHYTLDAAFVSQFENHVRIILGLEIEDTMLLSHGGMVNILGLSDVPLEVMKYGKIYWYGKKEARKRRKMGHVNIVGNTLEEVKTKIDIVLNLLYPQGLDL